LGDALSPAASTVLQCVVANWAELRLADAFSAPSAAIIFAFRKPGDPFGYAVPRILTLSNRPAGVSPWS
jgi:hypothetical protein